MSERTRCIETLGALIGDVQVAMLTTVRADGRLVSRPLRTVTTAMPFLGELWFVVRRDSHKAHEVEGDPHVNLAYASPERNTYVSVSGRARIVDNRAKLDELWTPAMELYFAGGRGERDLVLLRVDVDSAQYWDGPSGWLGLVTGEPAPLADNQSIDLRQGH